MTHTVYTNVKQCPLHRNVIIWQIFWSPTHQPHLVHHWQLSMGESKDYNVLQDTWSFPAPFFWNCFSWGSVTHSEENVISLLPHITPHKHLLPHKHQWLASVAVFTIAERVWLLTHPESMTRLLAIDSCCFIRIWPQWKVFMLCQIVRIWYVGLKKMLFSLVRHTLSMHFWITPPTVLHASANMSVPYNSFTVQIS